MMFRSGARRVAVAARKFSTEHVAPPPPPPPPAPKKDSSGALVIGLVATIAVGGGLVYAYQEQILDPRKAKNPKEASEALSKALADARPKDIPANAQSAAGAAAPKPIPAPPSKPPVEQVAATKKKDEPPADNQPVSKTELASLEKRLSHPNAPPGDVDWALIRERIVDLMDDEEYDDGSWGPVFVRLAWHASGTFDTTTGLGGSDGGLMRFAPESEWGANAGLAHPRARLDGVKKEFPSISYADLWTFAGATAIEEMGGPKLKWRPGRKDMEAGLRLPDGLLPDADGRGEPNPVDHLRHIFGRMGFTDRDIVALSGAHALGRCHEDRSGYWGPWTRAPTTFSNTYFKHLLEEQWTHKKTHKGKAWTGPDQYEDKTGELMMLPTDLALIHDPKTRPIVEEYAKDEEKFFKDFTKAWTKLTELGVRKFHGRRRYWLFGPRE